jgi:hypothetical protein
VQESFDYPMYVMNFHCIRSIGGPALKDPFTWGKVDMTAMARCLLVVCKQIYSIFLKENRLLRISSACYICKNCLN